MGNLISTWIGFDRLESFLFEIIIQRLTINIGL